MYGFRSGGGGGCGWGGGGSSKSVSKRMWAGLVQSKRTYASPFFRIKTNNKKRIETYVGRTCPIKTHLRFTIFSDKNE